MPWVSPTGHNDPDNEWHNEANAYDDNISTYASEADGFHYLELLLASPIGCSKVRILAATDVSAFPSFYIDPYVYIDVYYNESYHNIFEGTITMQTWVVKDILEGVQVVSKARVQWNGMPPQQTAFLFEFDFWRIVGPFPTFFRPI